MPNGPPTPVVESGGLCLNGSAKAGTTLYIKQTMLLSHKCSNNLGSESKTGVLWGVKFFNNGLYL